MCNLQELKKAQEDQSLMCSRPAARGRKNLLFFMLSPTELFEFSMICLSSETQNEVPLRSIIDDAVPAESLQSSSVRDTRIVAVSLAVRVCFRSSELV